jgi:hypothetical protein
MPPTGMMARTRTNSKISHARTALRDPRLPASIPPVAAVGRVVVATSSNIGRFAMLFPSSGC